jgi:hypothetical protein
MGFCSHGFLGIERLLIVGVHNLLNQASAYWPVPVQIVLV